MFERRAQIVASILVFACSCSAAIMAVLMIAALPLLASGQALGQANTADPTPASVLGVEVRSHGTSIGRIIDVFARADGSVEAAVVAYGGFLGIGSRKVVVPWSELRFHREGQ